MDGTEHHTGASAVVLVARIGLGICVVLISAAIFWRATAPLGTVTAGTGTVSCGSALSHDGEYTGQFPECQLRLDDAQRQLYALDVLWLMSTIGLALVLPGRIRRVILVGCLIVGAVVLYMTFTINGLRRL